MIPPRLLLGLVDTASKVVETSLTATVIAVWTKKGQADTHYTFQGALKK